MKHVTGGELWLPVFIHLPIRSKQIPIATNNLFGLRIPHNELFATILHRVEFVDIHCFSRSSASRSECHFAQTANLFHHVGGVLCRDDIDFIVAFVRHSQLTLSG